MELIKLWNDSAHEYLENKDPWKSIEVIQQISDPSSRILFNLSRSYEAIGQLHQSLQSLDRLETKDPHCAAAFFQRGIINFKIKRYPEALSDFESTHKLVAHGHIDYSQLGMRYKLYQCEILYNSAVTLIQLNQISRATEILNQARRMKTEGRHKVVETLYDRMQSGNVPSVNTLIELPSDMIFRPPKYKPKSDKKVDYLGQAKILSAIDANDQITGFEGPHRTNLDFLFSIPEKPAPGKRRSSEPILKISSRSLDVLEQIPEQHGPPPSRPVPRLPPTGRKLSLATDRLLGLPAHFRMSEEPPARPPPRKTSVSGMMTSMTMSTDENTAPPRPPKRISNPDPASVPTKVKVEFSCNDKQTVLLQRGASLRELKSTACQVFELKPADFDLWTNEPKKKLSSETDVKELWKKFQGEKLPLNCFGKQ